MLVGGAVPRVVGAAGGRRSGAGLYECLVAAARASEARSRAAGLTGNYWARVLEPAAKGKPITVPVTALNGHSTRRAAVPDVSLPARDERASWYLVAPDGSVRSTTTPILEQEGTHGG